MQGRATRALIGSFIRSSHSAWLRGKTEYHTWMRAPLPNFWEYFPIVWEHSRTGTPNRLAAKGFIEVPNQGGEYQNFTRWRRNCNIGPVEDTMTVIAKTRILLATEEPILALGASSLLAAAGGFEVIRNPGSFSELARVVTEEQPDVVLLDAAPEITPGLFAAVREAAPLCRIALWARSVSAELSLQASRLGVAGIVRRTSSNEHFLDQLRSISRGAADIGRQPAPACPHTEVGLTPRESQIVALLGQGLKNKEIASCLELSEATVKTYLAHLLRKVGARDRYELALLGLKNTYCGEAFWEGRNAFVTGPDPVRGKPVLRSLVLVEPVRRRVHSETRPPLSKLAGVAG